MRETPIELKKIALFVLAVMPINAGSFLSKVLAQILPVTIIGRMKRVFCNKK